LSKRVAQLDTYILFSIKDSSCETDTDFFIHIKKNIWTRRRRHCHAVKLRKLHTQR